MLRVLLCFMLLASWPGQAARGAVPGPPPYPASPQNRAPQTVSYIDVGTLYVGGTSATINASSYFSDPDGDTLIYSVNSPSPTIATVSISGSTVTVAPVALGTTGKIIVTARDPGGLTATQDFTVTVQNPPPPPPANRAPTAVGSISDVTLQVGGSSATRSVSGKFSDPDNDTLTYSVNSPNPSIATVSISGSTVTIVPVAAGTTSKIIVTATDPGGLTATQDFTATVEAAPQPPPPPPPANRAPTAVGSISDVTLQVGGSSATRSVAGKFSDPDGDTLTYSVNSPNPETVTVSISGSTVTIAPVAAGTTGKIVVTATDPGGETATQDFTATVEAAPQPPPPPPLTNRAPVAVGSISDVSLNKGGSSATRSVAGKFSDPDGDTLTYSVNSPNPSIVTVSISGSTVTIEPVATGSTGKIIVTATDPEGETAVQDFTATVTNQPPRAVGTISNITLYKNGKTRNVSVSGKFSDPNGDTLTYSATSDKTSVATASVSGSTVTVRSAAIGTATITVTAEDPDEATGTQTFTVTVINRIPQPQGNISKMTFYRGQAAKSTDVSDNFRDPDNDALTFTATSSDTSVATASVSGSDVEVDPGGLGSARVTVTATDTDDASNRHGFDVEVANRAPVVSQRISDKSLNKNNSDSFDASSHISDPDNDSITFSAASSDTDIAGVSVSGSTVTIESEDDGGDATVTVTATDAHNGTVSTDFTVTVRNRAPQRNGSIDAVTLYKNRHAQDIIVSGKFTDPDGDTLKYSALSSNTAVATASVSGGTVTITSGNSGSATITVKAEDIDNASATQRISVTVRNRAPEVVSSFEEVNLRVGGPSKSFDVSGNFSDPDGDSLTFSVDDPDSSIAKVSISGSEVTVAPRAEGVIGKVMVTATDTEDSRSEDFRVVVRPVPMPPPTPSCPTANTVAIMVPAMSAGGDSVTMDVSDYFTIPQGVTPTYKANNPDSTIADVSISGHTLTIEPKTEGSTGKVIVKVIANGCTEVTRDFNVTVGPAPTPPLPPTPTCPLEDTLNAIVVENMVVGGDSVTIDVSDHFTNGDAEGIEYSLDPTTQSYVTLSLVGDTLTIKPAAQGDTGKIIVRAEKNGCADATQEFSITVDPVPPIADCPAVKQMHPSRDLLLVAGGSDVDVNLNSHFTNLDKSNIKYTIVSSNPGVATASRTDSTLAVSPGAAGTAQVTVTVSRVGCGTGASQVFNVTVVPPPCPATSLSNSIPDQTLTAGGDSGQIDVSPYFTIPEGVTPTYTVNNPDSTIAGVSVNGSTVTITPVSQGQTGKVIVTVSATGCNDVTQDFNVTVVPPPQECPALLSSIAEQTLTLGGSAALIDLTQYFSLPADFVPIYVVNSTDTNVTTTSLAEAMLTVSPAAAGTDTVSVTVSKQDCDSVTQSFVVSVSLPCPAAITDAPIPDQTLYVGAGTTRIDLTQHFEHIDQDGFEIAVTSPNPEIAVLSIEDSALKIDPKSVGQIVTVTVTVTDTAESDACDAVSLTFMVTVEESGAHAYPYPWMISGENVYRLTGNVGIGVEDPDQKLVVDGKIKAEEYRLTMVPADYVFTADYDLMSLEDVERYIHDHGHLPGVVSGTEMKANGIGVSRMQTMLLEKIEELSLHVIEQHETLRAQGDSIDGQQWRIKLQNQRIRQLEEHLERLEQ